MVAGRLTRLKHHTGGLADPGRAEVSPVDQVAGEEGATGGAWVAQVDSEGAGHRHEIFSYAFLKEV